jgi:hypothetical protein
MRPSPEVQAKIWNDQRYGEAARVAHEWTHDFLIITEPQSASIPYHMMNMTGSGLRHPRYSRSATQMNTSVEMDMNGLKSGRCFIA